MAEIYARFAEAKVNLSRLAPNATDWGNVQFVQEPMFARLAMGTNSALPAQADPQFYNTH